MWKFGRTLTNCERGSVLALTSLLMLPLMGMMALVLDVGYLTTTRARLRQAADAAVLAGARHLPQSPSSAIAEAIDYSQRNGVALSSQDVSVFSTYVANDTITAVPTQTASLFFAPVLGLTQVPVTASAKAIAGSVAGRDRIVPWGIVDPDPDPQTFGFSFGQTLDLKLATGIEDPGNFQALAVDGQGDAYASAIANGSAATMRLGDNIPTYQGNAASQTSLGIGTRLGGDTSTFGQVVHTEADGSHTILNWACPRLAVLPVIQGLVPAGNSAQVIGLGLFFLEGYGTRQQGNYYITGRFIRTVVQGEWGAYGGGYGATVIRLAF